MFPDLSGPVFLGLYVTICLVGVVASRTARSVLGHVAFTGEDELHPYQLAALAVNADAAVEASVAHLLRLGAVSIDGKRLRYVATPQGDPTTYRESSVASLHPLDRAVLAALRGSPDGALTPSALHQQGFAEKQAIKASLADRGLILGLGRSGISSWVPKLWEVPILLVGVARILYGVSNHRPVGILVLLVAGFFAFMFYSRPARLSKAGKSWLKHEMDAHVALKTTASVDVDQLSPSDAALAVALFGPAVLAPMGFTTLFAARPVVTASTASSSVAGCSSCSSCGGCGGCGGCGE